MRFEGPSGKPNPLKRRVAPAVTPLVETALATNPGNLRMFSFVPGAARNAPLVVVLHGCGQSASGYDAGTGWSRLGAARGFAVLAVEQKAGNNPGTCFNWFNPEDVTRDTGEVASIAGMIVQMVQTHGLDPRRIFITGLSAGGAMTAAMLATYPEIFAAGAIIAGLPFGAASNVGEALGAMRAAPLKTPRQWGDLVRAASNNTGPWPRVSIWHGGADTTVSVSNAQASAAQWADLHGLKLTDAKSQPIGAALRLGWGDKLEVITLPAMGHGTPIDSSEVGAPAPYILETGISSTLHIAQFWGLLDTAKVAAPRPKPAVRIVPQAEPPKETPVRRPMIEDVITLSQTSRPSAENVILRALKAAGLIKRR